jgi:hypothetical protein
MQSLPENRTISISFNDGGSGMDPRDEAGIPPAWDVHWNVANWTSGTLAGQGITDITNLVDSMGIPTGVSVTNSGSGELSEYWNASSTGTGDQNMMVNFIQTDTNRQTITFSDIPYEFYDVYVYTLPDVAGETRMGQFTIGSETYYAQTDGTDWRNTGYVQVQNRSVAEANANPGNTIRFKDIRENTFSLEFGAAAGSSSIYGILCGLQIVPITHDGTTIIVR